MGYDSTNTMDLIKSSPSSIHSIHSPRSSRALSAQVFLENLFIFSDEVKKELPEALVFCSFFFGGVTHVGVKNNSNKPSPSNYWVKIISSTIR